MIKYELIKETYYNSKVYRATIEGEHLSSDDALGLLREAIGAKYYIGGRTQRTSDGKAWKVEVEVSPNCFK